MTITIYSAARRLAKDTDTSDSHDSDDDAPLATLVQPRRPGSSTSNASGRSLPPRPLIDIKSLSNSPLSNSPPVSVNPSPVVRSATPTSSRNDVRSPTNINERLSNLTQGLTRPKPASTVVPEPTARPTSDSMSPMIIGRTAPSRSTTASPIMVSSVEQKPPVPVTVGEDGSPAPKSPTYPIPSDSSATTPSADTAEFPPIRNPRTSLSLDDPTPIKPTPIHHRAPQSGFSVMSRPQHHSTQSMSTSTIPSMDSSQRGESLDSIGDFTAAMFSQIDLGFSPDEDRGSLDNTITKSAITSVITKSTVAASAVLPSPTIPAPGPTTPVVNPVGQTEPTPSTRSVLSDASPPTSVSQSQTSPRRLVKRPRSTTLTTPVSPQPVQPSSNQPQPQAVSRLRSLKPVKGTVSHIPGPRKSSMKTTQTHSPPPSSRHKRVPSVVSTSSESSDGSSSSAPSIAPKKQKQLQPQIRSQQAAPRLRSFTMNTLTTTNPPSPTKSSTNNSSSSVFNRPPQRPFAMRDKSPSSSTGDSSSGRLPITPRDGSDIGSELGRGVKGKQQPSRMPELFRTENGGLLSASNSEMGLKVKKLGHRKSASYDESTLKGALRGGSGVASIIDEERRRERRRSEAKNAIEVQPQILRPVGLH
jgi:serine/arginine repetitive matrix protein 2